MSLMSLKTQNIPNIFSYLVYRVAIYIIFANNFESFWSEFPILFDTLHSSKGIFAILSPLAALILTGLLSPDFKAKLVFWKKSNPLPATEAFTKLAPNDYRIDMEVLKSKINDIPTNPKEQSSLWYIIYK